MTLKLPAGEYCIELRKRFWLHVVEVTEHAMVRVDSEGAQHIGDLEDVRREEECLVRVPVAPERIDQLVRIAVAVPAPVRIERVGERSVKA
jgi:hypothetical protein